MKVISTREVMAVSGGNPAAAFIGGTFFGALLTDIFYNPVKGAFIKNAYKEHERLKTEFKNNPDQFLKEHTSFNGDN